MSDGVAVDWQVSDGVAVDRQVSDGVSVDRNVSDGVSVDRNVSDGVSVDRQVSNGVAGDRLVPLVVRAADRGSPSLQTVCSIAVRITSGTNSSTAASGRVRTDNPPV